MELGIRKIVAMPYEDAVVRTRETLKEHGFGVITEIDVRETIREKLNRDFRRYVILGACNPEFAHRALETNLDIGLLLPCNVIVYEEGDRSIIAAINPDRMADMFTDEAFRGLAGEVRERLHDAINAL
jgi:uncharacterized protein (DUF302 family)